MFGRPLRAGFRLGKRPAARPLIAQNQALQMLSLGNIQLAIWGQSNAVGRGNTSDLSTSPLSSNPLLAQYMNGTLPLSRVFIWSSNTFATLTSSNNGAAAGQFGPEFGIAVRWMTQTTDGNLYLTKEAFSGNPIDPYFVPGQVYYASYRNRANAAATWLANNGITIAEKHWLWVHGEADASQTQTYYQTRLQSIMDQRISDGLDTTTGRKVLAQMKPGSALYGSGVAAAKNAIASADSAHIFADFSLDYLQVDNVHCTARGQVQLGYDVFERLFSTSHIYT